MKFSSYLTLHGHLKVTKIYNTGESEVHYDQHNVITQNIKKSLLVGVYQSVTSDPVSSIQVGTGGTIDPEGKFPKQINQLITGLYSPLVTLTVTSHTLNADETAVTFLADLTSNEGNGSLVSEVGLFTQTNTLFAYKTFPAIPKAQAFSIHIEWTIRYT